MSSSHNKAIGDSKILQRKIPSTGRYNDIKARVNTGSSISRYLKRIEDMQTNYRFKNNELFKRMKVTTLAQLILQVANVSMQDDASVLDMESVRSGTTVTLNGAIVSARDELTTPDDVTIKNSDDEAEPASPRSSLQSVIRGVGEVDLIGGKKINRKHSEASILQRPYEECPYLILDVRDSDEFSACHIVGAKNFPIAMLSRTMNNYTNDILAFRNCPGRIIILYDEDERLSTVAATTMVERGFDNIFVLSGGLKVLGQKVPEGIVTGTYPAGCRIQPTKKSRTALSYEGIPADLTKQRFSAEDLDKINHYLDESLVPQDTGSRLSRQTNNSRHSNVSKASSANTFVGSRRAWR